MVRACEKNVNQQNCLEVAGMEAKYRPAQRQAKETMDGQCRGGCRSQRIYTEGDRTNSTVPGQKSMEKLRHSQAIGLPVQRYQVQVVTLSYLFTYLLPDSTRLPDKLPSRVPRK